MLRLNRNQNPKSERQNSKENHKLNDLSGFLRRERKDKKNQANSNTLKPKTLNVLGIELTGFYLTIGDYFLASSGRL